MADVELDLVPQIAVQPPEPVELTPVTPAPAGVRLGQWPPPIGLLPSQLRVLRQIRGVLTDEQGPSVVNVTGPLGTGKSAVAMALAAAEGWPLSDLGRAVRVSPAPDEPAVLDHADSDDAVREAARMAAAGSGMGRRLVVISRRSVLCRASWDCDGPAQVVGIPAWPATEVGGLAERLVPGDRQRRDLVVRLSGGNPLMLTTLSRVLRQSTGPVVEGHLAHRASSVIMERLQLERPSESAMAILPDLATCGQADDELLAKIAPQQDWPVLDELERLSIVAAAEFGLKVVEPFRTLLDLAHRWRSPGRRLMAGVTAGVQRRRLVASYANNGRVVPSLIVHALPVATDPVLGELFEPADSEPIIVRRAAPGDEDTIDRLTFRWAQTVGARPRNCRQMLEDWLELDVASFHLACGPDGTAVGMMNIVPMSTQALPSLERLLQQFTEPLARSAAACHSQPDAVFAGLVCAEGHPRARAELLRQILMAAHTAGRMVFATPWPEYQRLAERTATPCRGEVRDDPYDCGRLARVYELTVTAQSVPAWLERVMAACGSRAAHDQFAGLVLQAFERLRDLAGGAPSGLLGILPSARTSEEVNQWLIQAATELAAAKDRNRAEAGAALVAYYIERDGPHEAIASRMHLGRATYFRRRSLGFEAIAAKIAASIGM